jgi:hypothetical protein
MCTSLVVYFQPPHNRHLSFCTIIRLLVKVLIRRKKSLLGQLWLDRNACPIQAHVSTGLPHVGIPFPDPPRLVESPYRPPLALTHLPHISTLLFSTEDYSHQNTLWCLECYKIGSVEQLFFFY